MCTGIESRLASSALALRAQAYRRPKRLAKVPQFPAACIRSAGTQIVASWRWRGFPQGAAPVGRLRSTSALSATVGTGEAAHQGGGGAADPRRGSWESAHRPGAKVRPECGSIPPKLHRRNLLPEHHARPRRTYSGIAVRGNRIAPAGYGTDMMTFFAHFWAATKVRHRLDWLLPSLILTQDIQQLGPSGARSDPGTEWV